VDLEPAKLVATAVRDRGVKAIVDNADVTDESSVAAMVESAVSEFGKLDIMIANAGIHQITRLAETTVEDFDRIMRVNVRGVFLCAREAASHMVMRGSGKIINAASVSGHRASAFQLAYTASKFAVVGMTQALARELGPSGITVNAYCPGIVDTRMWAKIDVERSKILGAPTGTALEEALATVALGRQEVPEDVAGFVSFLASSDSDYMTGQSINICGGLHMY
jgi:meso-butanediol dehydrogenase/(S,S)-butanediol dehydrogenase/diacetyl reductase